MTKRSALLLLAASIGGCGYRPLRSGLSGHPKIVVVGAHASAPGGAAVFLAEEAATGARLELARYGALGAASDPATDRLRIEIVRFDERSEGIATVSTGADKGDAMAHARGIRVRLLARGVIEGASGSYETSDVEGADLVATPVDAASFEGVRTAAARRAARVAGGRVAHEVLGLP